MIKMDPLSTGDERFADGMFAKCTVMMMTVGLCTAGWFLS